MINNYLTANGQFVHNGHATPHRVDGLGGLLITRRTTAFICGFFVRAVQSYLRYGGLNGDTFGCAGSCVPVRQPRSVHHHSLAAFGDGLQPTHKRTIMANGFQHGGAWSFKLPDPFRQMSYFPLDTQSLAEMLEISQKTALRICQDQRPLKAHELAYLQMKIFGYIPDKDFLRYKVYFRDGNLYSHDVPNFEMSVGQLAHLYVWQTHYLQMKDTLEATKARIKELEIPITPPKTNLIDFKQAVAKRHALSHDREA